MSKNTMKSFLFISGTYTANIDLLKVNDRNNRKRREICSKLTIKTPERHQCFKNLVLLQDCDIGFIMIIPRQQLHVQSQE